MERLDFGELENDSNLKERVQDFWNELGNMSEMFETFFSQYKYTDLSVDDKVRYDLFLAFSINSLYWMYLRTKGLDPNQNEIKSQINRVREYMNRSKAIHDKKTMPRLNQDAAKRFVRSGLWAPGNAASGSSETEQSNPRKRKREDEND